MTITETPFCPHCGAEMSKLTMPPEAGYDCEFMFVCFNDDCSYYTNGWRWMWERFEVKSSYRHRINPVTGEGGPLPVWSPGAMRNRIIP